MTEQQLRQTIEEPPDTVSADGALTVREEWGDSTQEPYAPELFKTETVFEEETADDMPLDDVLQKPLVRPGFRPVMRLRLLRNDKEIPSREELKKQTFNDSSDFFEEAPDRLSGVVTSQELDALTAPEDAQEPQRKQYAAAVAQRLGGSVKSAGVHVGYFVTNIGRAVKRRRELSKRQKAGEERRRRQMERRRQERAAMERRRAAHDTPKQTNDDNRKQ